MVEYKAGDRVRFIPNDVILKVVEKITGTGQALLEMVNERPELFELVKRIED